MGITDRQVRAFMTSNVAAVREGDSLHKVAAAIQKHAFHHYPVLDAAGRQVVGVVSDRDLLKLCLESCYQDELTVGQVMTRKVVTIGPEATLAYAAAKMHEANVGSLLIQTEDGVFVGLLTARDLVRALATEAGR